MGNMTCGCALCAAIDPVEKSLWALMVDSGTVRHEREEIEQAVPYVDALLRTVRIRTLREEGWTVIRRKRRS